MPVVKTSKGKWKVQGSGAEHETKEKAEAQLRAIKAEQARRGKR